MVHGELTTNPYDYMPRLITWEFSYNAQDDPQVHDVVKLDKTDCECHGSRNQIIIRKQTVKV